MKEQWFDILPTRQGYYWCVDVTDEKQDAELHEVYEFDGELKVRLAHCGHGVSFDKINNDGYMWFGVLSAPKIVGRIG